MIVVFLHMIYHITSTTLERVTQTYLSLLENVKVIIRKYFLFEKVITIREVAVRIPFMCFT